MNKDLFPNMAIDIKQLVAEKQRLLRLIDEAFKAGAATAIKPAGRSYINGELNEFKKQHKLI